MEWLFVLLFLAILFGPIVWVVLRGRRSPEPVEDGRGLTAAGAVIRKDAAETRGPLGS